MNRAYLQASLSNEANEADDEEDPFAVFGDEDDDNEIENDNENEISTTTEPLMAPRSLMTNQHHHDEKSSIEFVPQRILLHDAELLSSIPSWPDPLYQSGCWEIVTTPQYGRAVRATQAIPAGTLLLIEKPLWDLSTTSTKDETSRTPSPADVLYQGVQWLLEQKHNNSKVVQYVEHLHPTLEQVERVLKSDTVTPTERDQIVDPLEQLQHDPRLQQMMAGEDTITVRRYYLLLQYNLLRTGLYLYVALWNHQHQTPNCIKLGNQIWTCRSVEPHEMLTIDYVPEISSRRAAIVWEHHKFRVPATTGPAWIPRYEAILQEFQEQYQLLLADETSHPTTQHLEWAMALEQAMLELLTDHTKSSVDDDTNAFLWIPCRLLYLQVGQYLLSSSTTTSTASSSLFHLTNQGRIALLERLLQQTQLLLKQQQQYYGPDHLHLATTYDELAQLCHYLVQQDPSTYYAQVSALESLYRKQHERIRRLYPEINDDNLTERVASTNE